MRVLVCGGRNGNGDAVWRWLENFLRAELVHRFGSDRGWPVAILMHGGASGVDEAAGRWAESEHIKTLIFKADWRKYGKSAGPRRNEIMLTQGNPDVVIAFPGGKGTANMVKLAEDIILPIIKAYL